MKQKARHSVTEAASILPSAGNRASKLPVTVAPRKLSRYLWWLVVLLPALAALPGCGGDVYSESLVYPLRTDPVLFDVPSGDEFLEPDRPGQLPLLNAKDMEDSRNPFHPFYSDKKSSGKEEGKEKKPWYIDPTKLPAEDQAELRDALLELFGTPAHPKVELISSESRQILQLDEVTLKEGSRLYRLYCLQCHGLTGDGRGPTAKWVNPHPRDYRKGLFKFQSVDQADDDRFWPQRPTGEPPSDDKFRPPRRDDLIRTLIEGVEGTAMQSYNMLSDAEMQPIVSYVIHLSIRGQAEEETIKDSVPDKASGVFNTKQLRGDSITGYLRGKRGSGGKVREIIDAWRDAQDDARKIRVGAYPFKEGDTAAFNQSIQNGYDIFVSRGPTSGGCTTCHYDFGRKAKFKFDQWGTMVRPRELTKTTYRGGRRPVDLYYRIHSGINGSGMLKQGGGLSPDQIWDVVSFVRTLPYPAMRKHLQPLID
jgi:mono/diheme cytochrome c family protein